ncbi:PREDICTED: probable basic-leucine zipper transcription factor D [Bactrocera latifrons]|uniref:probable basic-leucine zipper transcription factor D n=1 Tax=Bactrocera latifrons TaxID=174628 RepID=UPI0008DD5BC9|nr:PREDICTED: probable basic-leucine zipper transcription factor D [Bactrocera latifrons]
MDGAQKYKLITCVDPTKINVPIRNRFAKLTLSNKKKQQDTLKTCEECIPGDVEPIKRVSRNLLEIMDDLAPGSSKTIAVHKSVTSASTLSNLTEFSATDGKSENLDTENGYLHGNIGVASTISDIPHYVNPLLLSDSNGSKANEHDSLNNDISMKNTDDMQPLQVSDYNHTTAEYLREYNISTLTNDLSKMAVSAEQLTDIENDGIIKETTLLVSTESQRMSCDLEQHKLQISKINSRDDSCSAITISDSTVSECTDFNFMTSDIPESSHSADAFIPNTFSNEKADRMEAFLRDVSQQRRELEDNHKIMEDNFNSLRYVAAVTPENNIEINNAYQIHGDLAYAATESMTSIASDLLDRDEYVRISKTIVQADSFLKNDTLSMSKIKTEEFSIHSERERSAGGDPRRLAHEETELNSPMLKEEENNSIVCSEKSSISHISNVDLPEDSVIISETSSEDMNIPSVNTSNSSGKCNRTDEQNQSSPPPISIGNINISAKINIKISISQLESLEDESVNNDSNSEEECNRVNENSKNVTTTVLASKDQAFDTPCNEQKQHKSSTNPSDSIVNSNNNEENSDEEEPDVNFLTHAERLLTQVYGKAWKTPEVIRTLKRTSRTPKKMDSTQSPQTSNKQSSFKETESESHNLVNTTGRNKMNQSVVESALDDFSIFRRDIVQTNLDSTRYMTPNLHKDQVTSAQDKNFNSEPRFNRQRKEHQGQDFKLPITEVKSKCPTIKRQQNIVAAAERWRQLVDVDSGTSGDNASDDETLDKTPTHDDSPNLNMKNKSDEWSPPSDQSDDSDYEISQPKKGSKGNATKEQSKKSTKTKDASDSTISRRVKTKKKDDIIYLDLSKDEVTIQEGETNSPLANNDANFNTHLQNILRTCKATDRAKIAATPTTGGKSKRKLFTANFGEEDVDLTIGVDGVQPRTPVRRVPTTDEEILSHDMERVNIRDGLENFEIFNKHLEAIKRGSPVFNMTPEKSTDSPNQTKPSKILRERNKISEQMFPTLKNKYGFLKSLDVCVAKSLCDPKALFYRENYRTKKEELANLLYELYNEKLFQNKLEVPLQWNKKLCNTAGRCLNKKKMGTCLLYTSRCV